MNRLRLLTCVARTQHVLLVYGGVLGRIGEENRNDATPRTAPITEAMACYSPLNQATVHALIQ